MCATAELKIAGGRRTAESEWLDVVEFEGASGFGLSAATCASTSRGSCASPHRMFILTRLR